MFFVKLDSDAGKWGGHHCTVMLMKELLFTYIEVMTTKIRIKLNRLNRAIHVSSFLDS